METTDVWLVCFLKSKGYDIVDYTLIAKGRARFKFDIDENKAKLLKLEFIKSEISKIKRDMDEIKSLVF